MATDTTVEMEHLGGQNNANVNNGDATDGRNPRITRAVPELDDDEEYDNRRVSTARDDGVDDGLLGTGDHKTRNNGGVGPHRPSFPMPPQSNVPPGFVLVNGVATEIPDVNAYQHKKTLAQGMMDLALLSANANQLRYVMESGSRNPYYYPSIIFISLSIIFQVGVGAGLILNSRYNINDEAARCRANRINNYTIIGIFIVTVVNVFVSAFGVATSPPTA